MDKVDSDENLIKKSLVEDLGPTDTRNIVFMVVMLIGISVLLPWNALLTGLDYFGEQFPTTQPSYSYPLAMYFPNAGITLLLIKYGHKFSLKLRYVSAILLSITTLVILPLTSQLLGENAGYIVSLILIMILGTANAISQGSGYGFAGILPPKYMTAMMGGNGLSGILVVTLRAICLLIFPPNDNPSDTDNLSNLIGVIVYFVASGIVLGIAIMFFLYALKLPFTQFYLEKSGIISSARTGSMMAGVAMLNAESIGNPLLKPKDPNAVSVTHTNDEPKNAEESQEIVEESSQLGFAGSNENTVDAMSVFKKIKLHAMEVFLVFLITFLVFPGLAFNTHYSFTNEEAWFITLSTFIFNLFDTLGRMLPSKILLFGPKTLIFPVVSRSIFLLTFYFIAAASTPESKPDWFFGSDWFKILNMVAFALTNGYCSTLAMIYGPSYASDKEKEKAGIIMNLFLLTGIFAGTLIANFGVRYIPL